MKNLWITRPIPFALETSAKLEALGIKGVIDPLMEITHHPNSILSGPFSSVVLSSQNAIPALANLSQNLPIYVVGSATAKAVKTLIPQAQVLDAGGTMNDLIALILKYPPASKAPLLYLRGVDITTPLKGALGDIAVKEAIVYETKPRIPSYVDMDSINGILLYSKRTAEFFKHYVQENVFHDKLKALDVFCISKNVADVIKSFEWAGIHHALSPDEDGIINCIRDIYGQQQNKCT